MTTKYTIHESRRPLELDADTYDAIVSKAEEVDGKFGTQVQLTFSVPEYPEEVPVAWASANGGTLAKFYKWCTALLGGPPPIGSQVGLEDLVGKKCRIVVDEKETTDGKVVMAVTGVLKPKAAPKATEPKASVRKPLEPPADTPAPWEDELPTATDAPKSDDGHCVFCSAETASFLPDGRPVCEAHYSSLAEKEEVGQGALGV